MSTTPTTAVVISQDEEARLAEATREVPAIVARASALEVSTHAEAIEATEFLSQIASGKKAAHEARKFIVDPLNAHVKKINERVKAEVLPLAEADEIVRAKVQTFNREQARLREEQEAEMRRVAERQEREAREERDRHAVEARAEAERAAEAARIAREEAERAEAARNAERDNALAQEMADMGTIELAELIHGGGPEETRVIAARAEMERRRVHRQAQERAREEEERAEAARLAVRQAAERPVVTAPATEIAPTGPLRSTSGTISSRWRWVGEVVDAGAVPREYTTPDMKAINEAVRAGVREIPGVKIEQIEDLAVRAK